VNARQNSQIVFLRLLSGLASARLIGIPSFNVDSVDDFLHRLVPIMRGSKSVYGNQLIRFRLLS
jgi:hypothetical protein